MTMDGYMENAKGHLVPVTKVSDLDKLRHEFVTEQISKAKALRQAITDYKSLAFGDIHAFCDVSAEKYACPVGGHKGNFSLLSFDGRYKIQVQIQDKIEFDERLQVAHTLVKRCFAKWSDGASDNIKAIVNNAFDVDKEGNCNVARILSLRQLEIDDEDWMNAMRAIYDSIRITGSKTYVRFYERRESDGKFEPITLDFSTL